MFTLLHFLKSLLALAATRGDRDESYLAAAADIYDLERRMRTLDERGRNPDAGITFGLYQR